MSLPAGEGAWGSRSGRCGHRREPLGACRRDRAHRGTLAEMHLLYLLREKGRGRPGRRLHGGAAHQARSIEQESIPGGVLACVLPPAPHSALRHFPAGCLARNFRNFSRFFRNRRSHLRQDWAHPCHVFIGTGPAPAMSAPGPRLTPPTSAPGPRCPHVIAASSHSTDASWARRQSKDLRRAAADMCNARRRARGNRSVRQPAHAARRGVRSACTRACCVYARRRVRMSRHLRLPREAARPPSRAAAIRATLSPAERSPTCAPERRTDTVCRGRRIARRRDAQRYDAATGREWRRGGRGG